MREKLIELLKKADLCNHSLESQYPDSTIGSFADYLLANGVTVLPFVAMVERHIKNGKFDKRYTNHNGKYAVVYMDKSKWGSPLIDICEKHYNRKEAEKALEEMKNE